MPTYEYRCGDCGHTFEEFQSMSAEPLIICPNCKKETLKRVFSSSSGMIFKGTGFYQTDYKGTGGGGKKETKKDGKPEIKTEPSKEKPAETKTTGDSSSSSTPNEKK